MSPEAVLPVVNEYITGMTRVVFDHGGTVDKIVGDAVHAMFGAPLEQTDHAERGVRCALALDEFAEDFSKRQQTSGIAFGVTRVGVHTGSAVVGNFGDANYFNFTAYGDSVNTAARLQDANKHLGTRICVSAETASRAESFQGRAVGMLMLKGKSNGINAFEPLRNELVLSESMVDYARAYEALRAGSTDAPKLFASLIADHGEDPLAVFHLRRLLAGQCDVSIKLQ